MRSKRSEAAIPADRPNATALSLVIAGVLALGTAFLLANPWFGLHERAWPWEILRADDADLHDRVMLALWLLAGVWAVLLGLTRAHRVRAVGATALAAVLLADRRLGVLEPGDSVVYTSMVLASIGLGAGLLITRWPGARGTGRLLAGLGGITLLWISATTVFDMSLNEWWWRGQALFSVWDGDEALALLPRALLHLAAAAGILTLFGLTHRHFVRGAFGLLLAALLAPVVVAAFEAESDGWAEQLARMSIGHALVLWLLGVFAVFDLARGRMRAA